MCVSFYAFSMSLLCGRGMSSRVSGVCWMGRMNKEKFTVTFFFVLRRFYVYIPTLFRTIVVRWCAPRNTIDHNVLIASAVGNRSTIYNTPPQQSGLFCWTILNFYLYLYNELKLKFCGRTTRAHTTTANYKVSKKFVKDVQMNFQCTA